MFKQKYTDTFECGSCLSSHRALSRTGCCRTDRFLYVIWVLCTVRALLILNSEVFSFFFFCLFCKWSTLELFEFFQYIWGHWRLVHLVSFEDVFRGSFRRGPPPQFYPWIWALPCLLFLFLSVNNFSEFVKTEKDAFSTT